MRVQGLSSPQARIFVLHAAGFPSRISCSSNELCFDSSTAACQELLPMQRVCLCICRGVCKVAAPILTPFLMPSFVPFFKTKWEGGRKGQTSPVWPSPASGNTPVYRGSEVELGFSLSAAGSQQQPILSTSEMSSGWLDKYFLFTSFSPLLDNSRVNPPHHLLSPAPWYWHLRNTELFIFHWRAHTINFHISESSYCSLLSGSIEWWQ